MVWNSIGGITVNGWTKLPRFFLLAFQAKKAALGVEACVDVQLFRRGRIFFVLSVWTDPVAMKGFARSDVHQKFMREDAGLFLSSHNAIQQSDRPLTQDEAVLFWDKSNKKYQANTG